MKQKIRKGLLYLILGFVILFLGRLTYGYLAPFQQATLKRTERSQLSTHHYHWRTRWVLKKQLCQREIEDPGRRNV